MIHRLLLAGMLVLSYVAAPALADDTLTLDEAIRLAIRNNPALAAAAREADAARIGVQAARAFANPEILLTPGVAGRAGSDEEILFVQPLELNGARRARTRAASGEASAAQAAAQVARQEVVRDVKRAYWEVWRAQAVVRLNRENVEVGESLLTAARRQVDVGAAPGSQAIKAEVELARARQEMARAESELAEAKVALNTFLGRGPKTEFAAAQDPAFQPTAWDPEELEVVALANRPELHEARALLQARAAGVDAARALRRPDLSIQARKETFDGEGGIGLGISLPIIDWGSSRAQRARAEAELSAQEKRVESETARIRQEVQTALTEIRRAEAFVREYDGGVLQKSEQLAAMAEKGYGAGATSYLEVLEAQRTLRTVRTEYFAALSDHAAAKARLEWAASIDWTREEETR